MKKQLIAILLIALSTISSADEIKLKKGMNFLKVRKALLSKGWKPVQNPELDPSGVEKLLIERKIIELETCTITGVQYCVFNYKKNNKCLSFLTVNEPIDKLAIEEWDNSCLEDHKN